MSRYQNCFYYFRGPKNASREAAAAKQLEDNTTKALINVLEHGGPELTDSFLREVIGREVHRPDHAEFFLQEGPTKPAGDRLLVGLAIRDQIDPKSWSDRDSGGGSRIDGVIHLPGELTVLLETKVVEQLDGAQLNRHAAKWKLTETPPGTPDLQLPQDWLLISWTDVDRWARKVRLQDLNPVQGFLIQQLIEFLGFAGLSVSWSFETQHFDLFDQEPKDRNPIVAAEVKARLGSIWERIQEQVGKATFSERLGKIRVGNLGSSADHGWAQTHASEGSTKPNLTIEINADETMVNLVGWFDGQLARVRKMLETNVGAQFVNENPEYELVIFKRKGIPSDKGAHVVWKGVPFDLVSRIHFRDATAEALLARLDFIEESFNPKLEKLSVHIRRSWAKPDAVEIKDLPSKMATEVQRLLPVMDIARKSNVS